MHGIVVNSDGSIGTPEWKKVVEWSEHVAREIAFNQFCDLHKLRRKKAIHEYLSRHQPDFSFFREGKLLPVRILRPIRVGTDCSGIEVPILALTRLGFPFHHIFSSESNPKVSRFIRNEFDPCLLYSHVEGRVPLELPSVDLYVSGFPGQPFSVAGKQKGFEDCKAR